MPAQPGRRPKFDEQKQREFCAMVAAGCPRESAARYVGVTSRTVRNAAVCNDKFAEALRNAEMHKELSHLRNIIHAGATHWRASAWALERLHPQTYAVRKPETVTPEGVTATLEGFAEIMGEVIADKTLVERMLDRLDRVLRSNHLQKRDAKIEPGQ